MSFKRKDLVFTYGTILGPPTDSKSTLAWVNLLLKNFQSNATCSSTVDNLQGDHHEKKAKVTIVGLSIGNLLRIGSSVMHNKSRKKAEQKRLEMTGLQRLCIWYSN